MAESGASSIDPREPQSDAPSDSLTVNPPSGRSIPAPGSTAPGPQPHAALAPAVCPEQQPTVISLRPQVAAAHANGPGPFTLGHDMEGRRLGPYRLEAYVGGGGMGSVYRASDLVLGRTVAVKVLSGDRGADEETVRRFQNEAQSAARLDHENIARVFYVGEDDGLKYIVFEYIDGLNIRDLVEREGPLPFEEAISYGLQVAEAISHATRRDVVHRDIKPSNVLVTPEGRAKLVDMGLARLEHTPSGVDDLTATGVTLGTFDYISPEQARDPRVADVRSDLYSLGCTFYFMLTGRPPFPEGTVLQKLLSHSSDEPTDPQVLRPDLPDEIANIVRRLLAKNPDRRHQDPSELVGELLVAAENLGLHPTSQGGTVWISSHSPQLSPVERHLPWLAPLLILIVVVLALDWIWPTHNPAAAPEPPFAPLSSAESASTRTMTPPPDRQGPARGSDSASGVANDESIQVEAQSTGADSSLRPRVDERGRGVTAERPEETPAPGAAEDVGPPPVGRYTRDTEDARRAGNREAPSLREGIEPDVPLDVVPQTANGASDSALARATTARGASDAGNDTIAPGIAPRPDMLIVGDYPEDSPWDPSLFCTSLEAACRRALASPDIRVIELRYDGYRDEAEEPFTLDNPDLTVRAGDDFTPVVQFRPRLSSMGVSPSSMIRVVGGRLRIDGVQFEFDVPDDVKMAWQLFQLEQVEALELNRCVLTVRDALAGRRGYPASYATAFHQRVSVIDLQVAPGSRSMIDESNEAMDWAVLSLRNCTVRGEATMVRAVEALPFRFSWSNGLLVTNGFMLDIGGTRSDPADDSIRVDLEHVTAIVEQGLCRVDADDETSPFMMTLDINCSQCILMTGPSAPLIEHIGTVEQDPAELDRRLVFIGKRNFYENVEVCWSRKTRIRYLDGEEREDNIYAEEWTDRWEEQLAKWNRVKWRKLPSVSVPIHDQVPEDYFLEDRPGNLAIESGPGPNGGDVGFDPDALPRPYRDRGSSTTPPYDSRPPPATYPRW